MIKKKSIMAYKDAPASLVKEIRYVVAEAGHHNYCASRVYGAYNAVYGLNETPQICGRCVYKRARYLREWLTGYDEYAKKRANKPEKHTTPNKDTQKAKESNSEPPKGQSADVGASGAPEIEGLI